MVSFPVHKPHRIDFLYDSMEHIRPFHCPKPSIHEPCLQQEIPFLLLRKLRVLQHFSSVHSDKWDKHDIPNGNGETTVSISNTQPKMDFPARFSHSNKHPYSIYHTHVNHVTIANLSLKVKNREAMKHWKSKGNRFPHSALNLHVPSPMYLTAKNCTLLVPVSDSWYGFPVGH